MKTRNLDEAAYLLSRGHRPKFKKLAQNEAEFTFSKSDTIKKDSLRFLKGEAMVNVTKYLYSRTYLKHTLSKYKITQTETQFVRNGYEQLKGRGYYYIDENDSVQHAIFGAAEIHQTRYESGNYFTAKNDAVAIANKQKHPLFEGDKIGDNPPFED